MKKAFGYLLIGLALFLGVFWGAVTLAGIFRIVGQQAAGSATTPGEAAMLALRFILWMLLAAVVYFLGRRLVEPQRFERRILDLARDAVMESDAELEAKAEKDEVSELYGELSLRDLVLVNSALDREVYRNRHMVLMGEIRARLREQMNH